MLGSLEFGVFWWGLYYQTGQKAESFGGEETDHKHGPLVNLSEEDRSRNSGSPQKLSEPTENTWMHRIRMRPDLAGAQWSVQGAWLGCAARSFVRQVGRDGREQREPAGEARAAGRAGDAGPCERDSACSYYSS